MTREEIKELLAQSRAKFRTGEYGPLHPLPLDNSQVETLCNHEAAGREA